MSVNNFVIRRPCRACGALLYLCPECGKWFPPKKKNQVICSDACRMRKSRAKKMIVDKSGKKYHRLGEVKDKGKEMLAVKWYEKKQWHYALKPKEDFM
ncbi:hypothetical protein NXA99_07360 [Citrobacter amalonaticus]|uniref:hypothetical protein n=1 Tax=Citrobacter amalonaticus TaxID=35703 RepID=UPI00215BC462|nr:hypothetical protein [Citrobacter amalonaticus]MCR9028351.1 hypothetical protein [Citrobacter amalonaticus]